MKYCYAFNIIPTVLKRPLRQTTRMIKLTALLLIATLLQVNAVSKAQTVTLIESKAKLSKLFNSIKKQTGFNILIATDQLNKAKPIDVNIKNMDLSTALSQILQNQNLTYVITNKAIIIRGKSDSSPIGNSTAGYANIKGLIQNEKGEALAGATITVKGSNQTTTTDQTGHFTLANVNTGTVLIISFVGYERKEIILLENLSELITIKLALSTANLEEVNVVNTGYQSLSRERSAGSFSKPDMKTFNDRVGTMNIIQRLDGLVPGLTVNNAPGADQFQIRGVSTISASRSPLFVVDGVPINDIAQINPNDVADISVLKDATASSIWGARAANGVIVITTKKGNISGKLKVDYNTYTRLQQRPDLDYLPVLNSQEFIQASKEIFDPAITPWASVISRTNLTVPPHEQTLYDLSRGLITQAVANARLDSMSRISNKDQIKDLFYRNTWVTNHSLSVSGGSKKYAAYGSFNYNLAKNNGNVPDNNSETFKFNLRQDFKVSDRIQLYLITDITHTRGKSKPWDLFTSNFTPYQLFQGGNGESLSMPWRYLPDELRIPAEKIGGVSLNYIPLNEPDNGYTNVDGLSARLNGGLTVKIIKGLRFEGIYSTVLAKNSSRQFEGQDLYDVRSEVMSFATYNPTTKLLTYNFPKTGGRLSTNNTNTTDWTLRNQLVFNRDWLEGKHQLTVLVGSEVQRMKTVVSSDLIRGFDDDLYSFPSIDYKTLENGFFNVVNPINQGFNFASRDYFSNTEVETRVISNYSNLAYTFQGRYGINASVRLDQSNLFGKDKSAQNRPVWSVGGLWNMNREKFMEEFQWLNMFRLRATYGITGNSPSPGTASSDDIIGPGAGLNYTFSNGNIYRLITPANRTLTWELTKNTNIGADFGFLNNRISGSVDLYWKNTQDLLDQYAINPFAIATGATVLGNVGELKNKGIELSLTTVNIRSAQFEWRSTFNVAHNTNTVTKVNSTAISTGISKLRASFVEGYSAYPIFAYDYVGLDANGDPQARLNNGTITKAFNATKPEDILYMGTYQPKWSGGFLNSFRYQSFNLQANMIFNAGNVIRRDVNTKYTGINARATNYHSDFANRWKKPGDEQFTDIPSFIGNTQQNAARYPWYYMISNTNVIDGAFVKLRDITLSYDLPENILRHLSIHTFRVFAQVGNVMLWKANKYGIDPEFQRQDVEVGGIRALRTGQNTISVGANISL